MKTRGSSAKSCKEKLSHVKIEEPGWTETEDKKLQTFVKKIGSQNWSAVSRLFKGQRSKSECQQRWRQIKDPDVVKGPWTEDEDQKLTQLVAKYGLKNWSLVGKRLRSRNGKQCRERWINHLTPGLKRSGWTRREDDVLCRAHGILGNSWALIAKRLPGRSDNAIKNRWNCSLKKTVEGERRLSPAPSKGDEVGDESSDGDAQEVTSPEPMMWPQEEDAAILDLLGLDSDLTNLDDAVSSRSSSPTQSELEGGVKVEEVKCDGPAPPEMWSSPEEDQSSEVEYQIKDPDVVKGPWTEDEDQKLTQLVAEHGLKNWSLVGKRLRSRNGKQCRERWINHLTPGLKRSGWTRREDDVLCRAHGILGNSWALIAKRLPGRSDNAIKNRWNCSLKKTVERRRRLKAARRRLSPACTKEFVVKEECSSGLTWAPPPSDECDPTAPAEQTEAEVTSPQLEDAAIVDLLGLGWGLVNAAESSRGPSSCEVVGPRPPDDYTVCMTPWDINNLLTLVPGTTTPPEMMGSQEEEEEEEVQGESLLSLAQEAEPEPQREEAQEVTSPDPMWPQTEDAAILDPGLDASWSLDDIIGSL